MNGETGQHKKNKEKEVLHHGALNHKLTVLSSFSPQVNPVLIPTLDSALQPVSAPSSTHCGNPQREYPLKPSSLEAVDQKVSMKPEH